MILNVHFRAMSNPCDGDPCPQRRNTWMMLHANAEHVSCLAIFVCFVCMCCVHVYMYNKYNIYIWRPDLGEAKASDIAFYFFHWHGIPAGLGGSWHSKSNEISAWTEVFRPGRGRSFPFTRLWFCPGLPLINRLILVGRSASKLGSKIQGGHVCPSLIPESTRAWFAPAI